MNSADIYLFNPNIISGENNDSADIVLRRTIVIVIE